MRYEWSTTPPLNLSEANVTGGGGPWRRSLFLLPYALQRSAGTYRLTLTARLATGSTAYASVALLINSPPYGGALQLSFAGAEARTHPGPKPNLTPESRTPNPQPPTSDGP